MRVRAWLEEVQKDWSNETLHAEATHTYLLLQSACWASPKAGFKDTQPISLLWQILGTNWLNSSAVDILLELLEGQVSKSVKEQAEFLIHGTDLAEKVIRVFGKGLKDCPTWLKEVGVEVFEREKKLVILWQEKKPL